MTTEEAINQVAVKHGLGQTLVTGHAAKYWIEAMKLYAESERKKAFEDALSDYSTGVELDSIGSDYKGYATKNPLK